MNTFARAWERFWWEPVSTSVLGVLRIGYGLVLTFWTLTLLPHVLTFFGPQGLLPDPPGGRWWRTSLLALFPSETAVLAVTLTLLVAALALTAGLFSRVAAVVAWICLLSLQRRDPWVLNSGDLLLRNIGFLLALAPIGAALSVDRWRRVRHDPEVSFWDAPRRAPWVLRLIQLDIAFGYLFAVWAKARGTTWNDGTAMGWALRIDDLIRFPTPGWITDTPLLVNLATYGTLAVELSLAVLVWNRVLRPWVLAAGVALHVAIELTIQVGFFSAIVLVAYVAFVPPEAVDRAISAVRSRAARRAVPAVAATDR